MEKSRYRVRGITPLSDDREKYRDSGVEPVGKSSPTNAAMVRQLYRTLGSPRLADIFGHVDLIEKLAALWPGFTYLHPCGSYAPLKTVPIHLAPFLCRTLSDEKDDLAGAIKRELKFQENNERAINLLLEAVCGNKYLHLYASPLAMSMASALTRGSRWLKRNHEKVLSVILTSCEASYIALASGAWNEDAACLIDKISSSPPLVLQLLKSPILKKHFTETSMLNALASHPVYRTAVSCLRRNNTGTEFDYLHQAAKENVLAACVSLGIDPSHSDRTQWWDLVKIDGAALYWLGRTWHAGGLPMREFPYYDEINAQIINYPQWAYHWARDLEPLRGRHFVREIWPSPWAAELIVDLQLPGDLVLDLLSDSNQDEADLWQSTLLHWSAFYVSP